MIVILEAHKYCPVYERQCYVVYMKLGYLQNFMKTRLKSLKRLRRSHRSAKEHEGTLSIQCRYFSSLINRLQTKQGTLQNAKEK